MNPVVLLLGIAVVSAMGGFIWAVIEDDLERRRNYRIDRERETPVIRSVKR